MLILSFAPRRMKIARQLPEVSEKINLLHTWLIGINWIIQEK
jgi:hypothetical protein